MNGYEAHGAVLTIYHVTNHRVSGLSATTLHFQGLRGNRHGSGAAVDVAVGVVFDVAGDFAVDVDVVFDVAFDVNVAVDVVFDVGLDVDVTVGVLVIPIVL